MKFYRISFTSAPDSIILRDMEKAFAYLRVSGKGQVDGDGFDRQLIAIKKYAAANNLKIVQVFREEGVSGTKDQDNRPAFLEMLAGLLSNGTRTVLIEKLDRLARDLMIQESIVADFKRKGLTLISVAEPDLCCDDPSRKLMRQILGAFAEYEKSTIVAKLRGARIRTKAKTGRCEGAKPYGELAGEAEVVQRIRDMKKVGHNLASISASLNTAGIRARKGIWYPAQVGQVLKRLKVAA